MAREEIAEGKIISKAELAWKLKILDTKCVTLGIISQIVLNELGTESKTVMAEKIEEAMVLGLENEGLPSSKLFKEHPRVDRQAVEEALGEFIKGLRGV